MNNSVAQEYSFHQLANLFPMMDDASFNELVEDIKENGLREPIVIFEDQILDGRNRYEACQSAGIEPEFEHYDGSNPLQYVVSLNLRRRHLSESQRAYVAAKIANLEKHSNQFTEVAQTCATISQADAAGMMSVSRRSVQAAKAVQDKGIEELNEAVESGEIAVSKAAQIAQQPREEQEKTVAQLLTSSESNEWYTPAEYIEAARKVLGGIDLDPASCEIANKSVQAAEYFTKDDDGLAQDWRGKKVWMNPPYGRLTKDFVVKFLAEVKEGILLVNGALTEAKWFQGLFDHRICFTNHRIKFIAADGSPGPGSTHGNAFAYIGEKPEFFRVVFSEYGNVVKRDV